MDGAAGPSYPPAMTPVPTPEDLLTRLAAAIGVPAVLLALWAAAGAAASWVALARRTSAAVAAGGALLRERTGERQRAALGFVLAGAGFVATAYALGQLAMVTYTPLEGRPRIADGARFDWSFAARHLLGYQDWSRPSSCAVTAAAALLAGYSAGVLLEGVGAPLAGLLLRGAALLVGGTALLLCVGAAALIGLAGTFVLVLGLTHSSGYTPGMAVLYALWVALLLLAPLLAWRAGRAAEAMFGRPTEE